MPEKFNVLFINGQKYKGSILSAGVTLELLPGTQQLVIEYEEIWDITNDEHERLISQPLLVKFDTKAGKTYLVKSINLNDITAARRFARKPRISLVEQQSGRLLPVELKYRLKDSKFIAGFGVDADTLTAQEKGDQAARMLRYWWRQSDYSQQQHFLDWAKTNRREAGP